MCNASFSIYVYILFFCNNGFGFKVFETSKSLFDEIFYSATKKVFKSFYYKYVTHSNSWCWNGEVIVFD